MKVAFCCAADEKTKYLSQAVRWAQSVRWFGGTLAQADIFIGLTDPCPDYYRSEFERLGARVVEVPRVSDWHGPSNKLGILLAEELVDYDFVVMSDCDIVIVADFSDQLTPEKFRAKPADLSTLSNSVLEGLFQAAGQPIPELRLQTSIDRVWTLPYCNSGFIIFPGKMIAGFMSRWLHWNAFVLDNAHLLGERKFFCDQASFALTLAGFLEFFQELPLEMNFPCHLPLKRYPPEVHDIEPRILHYHDRVDGRTAHLLLTTLPGPDAAIRRFNARTTIERRGHLSNPIFWDERYLRAPELGSGIESRGEHADYKADVVKQFLNRRGSGQVIDFGCGDCALLDRIVPPCYVGVDGSMEVIRSNRLRFPEVRFVCEQLAETTVSGDFSLCFDVLIHQACRSSFDAVLDRVLKLTARAGLVNGFDENPEFQSDIVFFHQPLADALTDRGLNIRCVGEYRETRIYEWWR